MAVNRNALSRGTAEDRLLNKESLYSRRGPCSIESYHDDLGFRLFIGEHGLYQFKN